MPVAERCPDGEAHEWKYVTAMATRYCLRCGTRAQVPREVSTGRVRRHRKRRQPPAERAGTQIGLGIDGEEPPLPEPPTSLARRADPRTSHEAGALMEGSERRRSIKGAVIAALEARDGQTPWELGKATGLGYEKVWRRCSDLKNEGRVVADGERYEEERGRNFEVLWLKVREDE